MRNFEVLRFTASADIGPGPGSAGEASLKHHRQGWLQGSGVFKKREVRWRRGVR